ncbi:Elongation of very long chain fatty acids protein 7 [Pseudolycoriella hygida]|uniref:Elongation of very long chain fatty acids protein n=1 Tax=Pseudolycoriella hygida TaxID=35572 RepID=A0A9Q0S5W0_9DIPT|nr:Elongation of very long chain fatty acids protein 7 [Pseudolycoriella hygida]
MFAGPLVDTYPLYGSPLQIATILLAYLFFVLHVGPKFMKNRKPSNLKYILVLYNVLQVGYNLYTLTLCIREPLFWKQFVSFGCTQLRRSQLKRFETLLCRLFWHRTMIAILDLFDTVFFILCKKQSHVTFPHVQHHFITLAALWTVGKYFTGEELVVALLVNSFIHPVMYVYYFVATLGRQYRKYLWWKKYLTVIQIVQLLIIIVYSIASIWLSCKRNKTIIWLIIANTSFNLILFLNYFVKANSSKKLINYEMPAHGSSQYGHDYFILQQDNSEDYKKLI